MNRNPKLNAEGYPDPTAYDGTKEIIKEESEMERKLHILVHIIRDIANLAGFEVIERIKFRHKKTGKEFR